MATFHETDEVVGVLSGVTDGQHPSRFRHLIEHIQDAIVEFELVDGEPIVRGVNPSFVETFGYEATDIVGASLNEYIVPPWLTAEAQSFDRRSKRGETNYRVVERETKTGLRSFLYRGIPYESANGNHRGFAVYTDLTDEIHKESRIKVLNRLLRHNLRNKINIISGHSAHLSETLEFETAEEAAISETISETAAELEKLADEASDIARTLNTPIATNPVIDCVPLIQRVADQFDDRYPTADITVDLPTSLEIAATDRLEIALESVIENAIEHNPAKTQRVHLTTRSIVGSAWIALVVDDDGPSIPSIERAVITGEKEITPVEHGSGLGLWVVKWTVDRLGGTLEFEESPMGGNRVKLRLPKPER